MVQDRAVLRMADQ